MNLLLSSVLLGILSGVFVFIPLFVSIVLLISNWRKTYSSEGKRILPLPALLFRIQNILGYLIFLFLLPRFLLSSIAPTLSFFSFVFNIPIAILDSSDLLAVFSFVYSATIGAILTPLALLLFVVFFVSSIITGFSSLRLRAPAQDVRTHKNGLHIFMLVLSLLFLLIFFGTRFITGGQLENALTPKGGTVIASGITEFPKELLRVEFLTQTGRGSTQQFKVLEFKNEGSGTSLIEGPIFAQPQYVMWSGSRGITLEPNGPLDYGKHNRLTQETEGKTKTLIEAHEGKFIRHYIVSPGGGYVAYSEMDEEGLRSSDSEEKTYLLPLLSTRSPVLLPFIRVVDFVSEYELVVHAKGEKNERGWYSIVEMLYDVRSGSTQPLPPQHQTMLGSRWSDRSPTGALYYVETYYPTDAPKPLYEQETVVISKVETLSPLTTKAVLTLSSKTTAHAVIGDAYYELIRKNESDPQQIFVELWRYNLLVSSSKGELIFTFPKGMVPYVIMPK